MKVAVVCPDDLSIVLFCKGIIDEFRNSNNAEMFVICDYWGDDKHYAQIIESWGVKHIPLKINRHISPLKDLAYTEALFKIFKKEKIDIVVNISTKPNIYGTVAARFARVTKILLSVWGRGTAFLDNSSIRRLLLKLLVSLLYFISSRLSTRVWFTNLNDFDYFISMGIVRKSKTILTKNYVSTEEYFPYTLSKEKLINYRLEFGLSENDKVVIMVARMIWAKGVREYIGAAQLLKNKLPQVKFILVGPKEDGSPDAIPEVFLKESKRSTNFQWIGFRKDVKDLYSLSDVAVLPSYYREGGYPRALTEPMAMGKPVIAADSVDCRAPVEHGKNGYLVPIKDSEALANAIETLMKDDVKRLEFGLYSREKVEKEYDEKLIVRQVIREFLGE